MSSSYSLLPETIKKIQTYLIEDGKIHAPTVIKINKYLENCDEPYHEIQLIPNHLLSENVLKILKENNVSLYREVKCGEHPKHMRETNNEEKITYIFIVQSRKPNNILLTSTNHYAAY